MKVAIIANGNGLNPSIGGSLKRTIEIAKRFRKMGHEVHFLTTIGGYKACQSEKLNAYYYIFPASILKKEERHIFDRILAYLISTMSFFLRLRNLPKCDVVCTDSDYFCDTLPAMMYKRINNAQWVAISHHLISISWLNTRDFIVTFLSKALQLFSFLLFKGYADKVLVYNSEAGDKIKNQLTKIGIPHHKIFYVNNGVDIELIDSIKPLNVKFDACFIGGLRPSKGLYDIVPIWEKVTLKIKAKLVVVGGGLPEYENYLKEQIKVKKLNNYILLVGAKSHEEAIKILKASKIFFFPSHEEGWGIVICEALACKKPIVAYDLPVYKRPFGDSIFYVPRWNVTAFAEKVIEVLKQGNLDEIGEKNYNVALKYSWDRIAEEELNIINKSNT